MPTADEAPAGTRRRVPEVRRIGPGVPYLDGAEATLLDVMLRGDDLSSGSDELDDAIVDWPTRYHLSHQRSNLLRPLRITPSMRVLDVGAGTGSLARWLGEQGASVVALEGNMARAEVAAARCHDLPDVEVLCGTIDDLDPDERFDLVTVIGVLEYSAAAIGGSAGPAHLLDAVRSRLRPGGAMALAIENQLGLKYLLGGAEDHRGVPWIGLDDYPGPPGARTWSRQVLGNMLRASGFDAQRWLYPYPDYKLPTIVLHEQLFDEPDHEQLIDQLVLRPVAFPDAAPARLADASAAHRVLVRAGLGRDVSSSFLVVAGASGELPPIVSDDVLAWIDGNHRRSAWRRHRELTTDRTLAVTASGGPAPTSWLSQDPGADRPFERGQTLGQDFQDHLRNHDLDAVRDVLRRWWDELDRRADEAPRPDDADLGSHPFLPADASRVLPDGHLDVNPSNFVDHDGTLVLIDDEWQVGTPVDLRLVTIRALWVLGHETVTSGLGHPWNETTTVREVFDSLCAMVDLTVSDRDLDQFIAAELDLQQLVSGASADHLRATWLNGEMRGLDHRPDRRQAVELEQLRAAVAGRDAHERQLREAAEERERQLRADAAELESQRVELAGQVDHYLGVIAAREASIEYLGSLRGFLRTKLARRRLPSGDAS